LLDWYNSAIAERYRVQYVSKYAEKQAKSNFYLPPVINWKSLKRPVSSNVNKTETAAESEMTIMVIALAS
jgi:hypothetical protein